MRYLSLLAAFALTSSTIVAADPPPAWAMSQAGEEAVLNGPGGVKVRLQRVPPNAEIALKVAPDTRSVAVLVSMSKFTEVMLFGLTPEGNIREIAVPVLPADSILKEFPRAGKPAKTKLRLDAMSIENSGWGSASRFAMRVRLSLVDDASGDIGWHYLVDAVLELADARAGLKLLNVEFKNDAAGQ